MCNVCFYQLLSNKIMMDCQLLHNFHNTFCEHVKTFLLPFFFVRQQETRLSFSLRAPPSRRTGSQWQRLFELSARPPAPCRALSLDGRAKARGKRAHEPLACSSALWIKVRRRSEERSESRREDTGHSSHTLSAVRVLARRGRDSARWNYYHHHHHYRYRHRGSCLVFIVILQLFVVTRLREDARRFSRAIFSIRCGCHTGQRGVHTRKTAHPVREQKGMRTVLYRPDQF